MRFLCCLTVVITLLIGTSTGCKKKPLPAAPDEPQAKAEPEKKAEAPKPEPKKPEATKPDLKPVEYKGLAYNIRMAAMRPEIQNDLKQIGAFYQADLASGSPPTTVEAMKQSLKTAGHLVKKIDEKIYVINLHGKRLQPHDILAYEREASSPAGFCVVRASGEVDTTVPFEQMWNELYAKK